MNQIEMTNTIVYSMEYAFPTAAAQCQEHVKNIPWHCMFTGSCHRLTIKECACSVCTTILSILFDIKNTAWLLSCCMIATQVSFPGLCPDFILQQSSQGNKSFSKPLQQQLAEQIAALPAHFIGIVRAIRFTHLVSCCKDSKNGYGDYALSPYIRR